MGNGGLFAVYSYVAPILVQLAGFSSGAVVWVLVAFGVGTTLGTLLGGRLGDRFPMGSVVGALVAAAGVCALLTVTVSSPVGAVVTLTVLGVVGFAVFSPLQNRVITASGGAALMVSAATQAAFNVANAMGAFLGAQVLQAGRDYRAVMLIGAGLAGAGAVVAALAALLERTGTAPLVPHDDLVRTRR